MVTLAATSTVMFWLLSSGVIFRETGHIVIGRGSLNVRLGHTAIKNELFPVQPYWTRQAVYYLALNHSFNHISSSPRGTRIIDFI